MKNTEIIPLVEEFVKVKHSEYSEFTLRNYKSNLLEFNRYLKKRGRAIPEFTAEDLATFINERMESGLATSTINGKLWAIKTFSKFLWYREHLSDKEYKAMDEYYPNLPKNEDTRRALSEKEVKENLKILKNPMYRMLFFVGVNYGLRTSEYASLKVSDIHLDSRYIEVHGKGNKFRKIKIIRSHVKEWRDYLRYRSGLLKGGNQTHDFLFFTSRGKATKRSLQRFFNRMSEIIYGEDKEKYFTPHILRFTFATRLYLGGMRLLDISKALGHNSIRTTQMYLRIEEKEALQNFEDKAERILGG